MYCLCNFTTNVKLFQNRKFVLRKEKKTFSTSPTESSGKSTSHPSVCAVHDKVLNSAHMGTEVKRDSRRSSGQQGFRASTPRQVCTHKKERTRLQREKGILLARGKTVP